MNSIMVYKRKLGHFKVCFNNKLLYVRCTKCANSSLYDLFYHQNGFNKKTFKEKEEFDRFVNSFRGYKFGIIRNPLSRLLSAFYDKIDMSKTKHRKYIEGVYKSWYKMGMRYNSTLNDLIDKIYDIPDYAIDHHLSSQSFRYLDKNNRLLVDKLVPIEKLPNFLKVLRRNWKIKGKLFHMNRSANSRHYKTILTSKVHIQKFKRRYRKDFELTGYKF